jgi:hypothetical protein
MAISELQLALIGAGAAGVVMVWGLQLWQDRKHRKTAERIFKGRQGDALLGGGTGEPEAVAADARREPGVRREPDADAGDLRATEEYQEPGEAVGPQEPAPEAAPLLPPQAADEWSTACFPDPPIRFRRRRCWAIQNAWAGDLSKPLHWLARSEDDGEWRQIDADDAGATANGRSHCNWSIVAARSDGELGRFFDGVQQVAQQTARRSNCRRAAKP